MNTNIVISLDTRRAKKDGSFPLVMRLGHNERTTSIPLGISLKKKDWDDEARTIRKSYSGTDSVTRLNNLIQKKKSEAMDVIMKLHEAKQLNSISITELKSKIYQPNRSESFYDYTGQVISSLKEAKRFGTARSYKGVKSVLKEYWGENRDLRFQDITYQFLVKFETNHIGKGNTLNGLAVYMRTVRAIYNKAIKEGIVEQELYPFTNYKIKTIPTEKRALELTYLKKVIELNLSTEHECFSARNYFVASYMMYGMNFMDMAFLKKTHIQNGRILYRRKKTSKLYDIKLTKNLEITLSYYSNISNSDFIFPIIKREEQEDQDKDIMWARKRYNKKLKDLAKLCGIESNLTSYVSRHSFATQAMLSEVPVNAISTMLGHSSIKTTQIYLKSLPTNILDDYNAKITGV